MVDSRAKGARAETVIRDKLREITGLKWERTPGSGALGVQHGLKGDLYVPNCTNNYAVEVKHYAEDHLTSALLTSKNSMLIDWWDQAVRQGLQVNRKPLLIFKFDRSKIFVAFDEAVTSLTLNHISVAVRERYLNVALLEDYVKNENPKFVA